MGFDKYGMLLKKRELSHEERADLGLPLRPSHRPPHTAEGLLRELVAAVITYLYEQDLFDAKDKLRKVLDKCEVFGDPSLAAKPSVRTDIEHNTGPTKKARLGPI